MRPLSDVASLDELAGPDLEEFHVEPATLQAFGHPQVAIPEV